MVEHPKSKSTGGFYRPDRSPCANVQSLFPVLECHDGVDLAELEDGDDLNAEFDPRELLALLWWDGDVVEVRLWHDHLVTVHLVRGVSAVVPPITPTSFIEITVEVLINISHQAA